MGLQKNKFTSSRILIVDDNKVNIDLLAFMLKKAGYSNVHSTTDPTCVVTLQLKMNFDIILLDIKMPIMNGLEVMEHLNRHLEEDDYLPVLVLTASSDMETRMMALSSGAKDFVTKPFQQDEVLNRINNMLETRHLYKYQKRYAKQLRQEVKERTQQIFNTQLGIIHCLGKAAEYRDCETGLHVIRMSKYSALMAKKAGFSDEDAEYILLSSPLHDIGKIGIPDNILLKKGRLNNEEMEIMKTHAALGATIIPDDDQPIFIMAKTIAIGHHERWDGTGYPSGLAGTAIPLVCRIVAICDVFDALISSRPYKEAWPLDEVLSHIKLKAGSHFDPDLVTLFLEALPEILLIRESHSDAPSEH